MSRQRTREMRARHTEGAWKLAASGVPPDEIAQRCRISPERARGIVWAMRGTLSKKPTRLEQDMDKEIRLDETFATLIPERPKTPTMSPEEQRERYGVCVADVEAKIQPGESFADAARRLSHERARGELREASRPKEQPSQEALWHASNERDQKVKAHLKHWGLPISKYVEEAQKLAARGEL